MSTKLFGLLNAVRGKDLQAERSDLLAELKTHVAAIRVEEPTIVAKILPADREGIARDLEESIATAQINHAYKIEGNVRAIICALRSPREGCQ